MTTNYYTVIQLNDGIITTDHVFAANRRNAVRRAREASGHGTLIAVIEGHHDNIKGEMI